MTLEELNTFVTTQANVSMEALLLVVYCIYGYHPCRFLNVWVGATRMKNAVSSGVKNLLAFAFMILLFGYSDGTFI